MLMSSQVFSPSCNKINFESKKTIKKKKKKRKPKNAADYSKVSYWDSRYKQEPNYDWFSSVYAECVTRIMEELWSRFGPSSSSSSTDETAVEKTNNNKSSQIRILHLGTGNSRLVHDLAISWYAKCNEKNITNLDLV